MNLLNDGIYFNNINKNLAHLDYARLNNLILDYCENIKSISDLKLEYKIRSTNTAFHTILPSNYHNTYCVKCGAQNLIRFKRKSRKKIEEKIYCSNCGHIDNDSCNCEYCKKDEEEKVENIKDIINCTFYEKDKISLEDLDLKDRLYLASILRSTLSEDMSIIGPINRYHVKIAPNIEYEIELIKSLIDKKLIVPCSINYTDGFMFKQDYESEENPIFESYNIYNVEYLLNIEYGNKKIEEVIKYLMYPNIKNIKNINNFIYEMWKEIAYNECIDYLLFQMKKVKFDFNPGKKTKEDFTYLVENFSISQIYKMIYSSISRSAHSYLAGEKYKKHAANSVINSCRNYAERAISENWKIDSNWNRPFSLEESYLTQIFSLIYLNDAKKFFYEKPSIISGEGK